MRKFISVLLFLLITVSFCACGKKEKSASSENKQYKQRIAYIVSEEEAGPKRIADYDLSGNMIKEVSYNADGSISDTVEFKYDKEGRLIEKTSNAIIHKYEYDKDGNLTKETTYSMSGTIEQVSEYVYEYAPSGQISTRKELNSSGELTSRIEYEYDSSGHRIKETFFRENTDLLVPSTIESEYDTSGNIVKESYKYEIESNNFSIEYTYDASGNLTGENHYTYSHGLQNWITYEYVY